MRTFVTGATGFLGSYLVESLVRQNANVMLLVRHGSDLWRIREQLPGVQLVEGDLTRPTDWQHFVANFAPETVLHAAWYGVGNAHRNDGRQADENIRLTVALAQLAKDWGCRTFVGIGSQAEYGPYGRAISETDATHPTTLYGAAKLSACHLSRVCLASSPVRFVWLRLFSSYGPKDNPQWLLPGLVRDLQSGRRPALTAGEQRWDFLHVADAARAVVLAGSCDRAEGVYNLGSGQAVALRSVIERVRDLIDPTLPLGFGEVPYRPDQVMHLEADRSRLSAATGWEPEITMSAGLPATVNWFLQQALPRRNAA